MHTHVHTYIHAHVYIYTFVHPHWECTKLMIYICMLAHIDMCVCKHTPYI